MNENNTKPLIAIVGRPNVGKSTLFNRLSGRTDAVVSHVSGTTRDRITAETVWGDVGFALVDTGGLDLTSDTEIGKQVRLQIGIAMNEADIIIMMVDSQTGITAADKDMADSLRSTEKPLFLAANKADNTSRTFQAAEFFELGLGDPLPISAYHNLGIDDLMAKIVGMFANTSEIADIEPIVNMAIVGRPNVGKSMLLNSICKQERAIVTDIPGTTRDALDTLIKYNEEPVRIVDTAGIRRRGRIVPGIEQYSIIRTVRVINRASVTVLLMDATELATSQDTHIANLILEAYKGMVLTINKWDLAKNMGLTKDSVAKLVKNRFKFAIHAPICYVSALNSSGIVTLLETITEVHNQWTKTVPKYHLKRTILSALNDHPPATIGRRAIKIYDVIQDQTSPPSFTFYTNRSKMVHFSYKRYLENTIRNNYGFDGSPIKIRFKNRGE